MADLDSFARLAARDHGLCVVSVLRDDNSLSSSVVNAGCCPTRSLASGWSGW
jgi:hypothetical protein